jgi:hypothetical protein
MIMIYVNIQEVLVSTYHHQQQMIEVHLINHEKYLIE